MLMAVSTLSSVSSGPSSAGMTLSGHTIGFRVHSPDGAQWNTTVGAETGAITPEMYEQTFLNEFSINGIGV